MSDLRKAFDVLKVDLFLENNGRTLRDPTRTYLEFSTAYGLRSLTWQAPDGTQYSVYEVFEKYGLVGAVPSNKDGVFIGSNEYTSLENWRGYPLLTFTGETSP